MPTMVKTDTSSTTGSIRGVCSAALWQLFRPAYVCGRAVGEAGVGPPRDGLVRRELAGPLPLEEEYRLPERVGVIGVPAGSDMAGA
jgi:hypothetical protein